MIAESQTIASDRRRSRKIEHGSIFCDHDRRIADDRRSVFPYDRRRSQNFLRSAIRDRLRSYGNQPLVARICDNCDAHCYYSLFVMNIFSILMVPRVVFVARYTCSKQF